MMRGIVPMSASQRSRWYPEIGTPGQRNRTAGRLRPVAGNETYTHGHHETVLRSHTWRTAENSAGYLLPHLRPGMDLLDLGCGPGTITVDLAGRVAPGRVLGVDASDDVIAKANAIADGRAEFRVDDAYDLDVPDASFD